MSALQQKQRAAGSRFADIGAWEHKRPLLDPSGDGFVTKATRPDTSGAVPISIESPVNRHLATFDGGVLREMRLAGAWVSPINRVAVAFPSYGSRDARVYVNQIDTARTSASFGEPVGSLALAYRGTDSQLRGLSATSVRTVGGVDAVFALWNSPSDGSIHVFSVNGADGAMGGTSMVAAGGVVTSVGPGVGARVIDRVAPAVEVGRRVEFGRAAVSKVLLAFRETRFGLGFTTPASFINVGFLTRGAGGDWRFRSTALIPVTDTGTDHGPDFNVAAAYDATRSEWGVAWYDGLSVYMCRVDFDGRPLSTLPSRVTGKLDPWHSGLVLSFNLRTSRYLIQHQHDLSWAGAVGSGVACLDERGLVGATCGGPGGDPEAFVVMGNVWATSVDYSTGHEWRVGGRILHGIPCGDCDPTEVCGPDLRCTTSDGGLSTPGVSFQSPEGRRFSLAGLERPNIWPNVPPDIEVALHQYVRVPSEALTVLLFAATSDARGETAVRYTFATEASDVPFDE